MALKLEGVNFQNFKNLDFLAAMNAAQLNNYLSHELEDIAKLQAEIGRVRSSIGNQLMSFGETFKIKSPKMEGFTNTNTELINRIRAARAEKVKLTNQLKQLYELEKKTRKLAKELVPSNTGAAAHDAYSRVMDALGNQAADLRETWDSDDIIAIDDYVVENNVSYEEAKAAIENRETKDKVEEIPEGV